MSDTIKIRISADPFQQMSKRVAGMYDELFAQLTPQQNCLIFEKMNEMEACSQSLERWKNKHAPGAKVRTTKSYTTDGLPRCWLIYPKEAATAWNPAPSAFNDDVKPTQVKGRPAK